MCLHCAYKVCTTTDSKWEYLWNPVGRQLHITRVWMIILDSTEFHLIVSYAIKKNCVFFIRWNNVQINEHADFRFKRALNVPPVAVAVVVVVVITTAIVTHQQNHNQLSERNKKKHTYYIWNMRNERLKRAKIMLIFKSLVNVVLQIFFLHENKETLQYVHTHIHTFALFYAAKKFFFHFWHSMWTISTQPDGESERQRKKRCYRWLYYIYVEECRHFVGFVDKRKT